MPICLESRESLESLLARRPGPALRDYCYRPWANSRGSPGSGKGSIYTWFSTKSRASRAHNEVLVTGSLTNTPKSSNHSLGVHAKAEGSEVGPVSFRCVTPACGLFLNHYPTFHTLFSLTWISREIFLSAFHFRCVVPMLLTWETEWCLN